MRFRIVSDGTPFGTRVYAPSGEDVTNAIFSIGVKITPNDPVRATFEVAVEADVEVLPEAIQKIDRRLRYHLKDSGNDKVNSNEADLSDD